MLIGELYPFYLADDQEKRRIMRTIIHPELGRAQVYSDTEMDSDNWGSMSASSEAAASSSSLSTSLPLGQDSGIMIESIGSTVLTGTSHADFSGGAHASGHTTTDLHFTISPKTKKWPR